MNSSTRLPDRLALLFSFNSFVAAMLALYIALAIGLSQPSWAMMTAFIVSHPLSGAVRSKALYRLAGTALGAIAAVVMVPLLANAPVLLSGALALWVGGCLSISLLDRTPRSYLLMLAGYTAAIIAFPSVANPGAIFDAAVSRVTEIGLGILCATTIHSLIFPQPVGDALQKRLAAWLEEADRWALDILRHREAAVIVRDRQHLAAAASEIHLLATHLPFDTSRLDETAAAVQALHNRMVLLIPLLSGIADRMATLAAVEDREVRELIDADLLGDWAQVLRVTLFTPMVKNAAMGEILKVRLQASARLWLVEYASEECQVLLDYDRRELERLCAGGDL